MDQVLSAVQAASNALWVLLALAAISVTRGQRGRAPMLVLATFIAAAGVVIFSVVAPEQPEVWATKAVVIALLAIPVLLHEFVLAIEASSGRLATSARAITGLLVVATLTWREFPGPMDAVTMRWSVYAAGFLLFWGLLAGRTARRLWRASREQPNVVRQRLRLLAGASVGLGLSITVPQAAVHNQALAVAGAVAGIVSGALFLVAFHPPSLLRSWWREPEDEALVAATRELMLADGASAIARILLPGMARLFAARGAVLRDARREVLATYGDVPQMRSLSPVDPEVLTIDVAGGQSVVLWPSPYAPLLGQEEHRLAERLAVLADLALSRADLLASERAARRDAEEANAEVESLVATITHDLRNPLTAISGMADLLGGQLRGDVSDRGQTFVSRIQSNAEYMTCLVNDILCLAEVRSGTGLVVEVDLAVVIHDLARDLRVQAPAARVNACPLPVIMGDPTRVRRVLDNLVGNAVAHGERQDITVWIDLLPDPDDGWFQLSVRDNGKGIAPADAQAVFGMFRRGEDRSSSGTGLGLAIARRTIELMGGTIWVASSPTGADVRLRLPRDLLVGAANLDLVAPPQHLESSRGELADHPAGLLGVAAHGAHGRLLGR